MESEQPPTRIYILDYGTDDCAWCDDPDPSGYGHRAVEYVRKDTAISTILSSLEQPSDGMAHAGDRARHSATPIHTNTLRTWTAMLSKYKEENGL